MKTYELCFRNSKRDVIDKISFCATYNDALKILSENYNVQEITPVDMFPNTCHVENVCLLNKEKSTIQ